MTFPENGAIAAGDAQNGALGLANGASYYYREIDSGQRKAIHAAGGDSPTWPGVIPACY